MTRQLFSATPLEILMPIALIVAWIIGTAIFNRKQSKPDAQNYPKAWKRAGAKKWNSSVGRVRSNKINNLFGEQIKSPEEFKTRWRKVLISEQNDEPSVATGEDSSTDAGKQERK